MHIAKMGVIRPRKLGKLRISESSGSNLAEERATKKDTSAIIVLRVAVGGAAGCGVLQEGSSTGECRGKVSGTMVAALGHQVSLIWGIIKCFKPSYLPFFEQR